MILNFLCRTKTHLKNGCARIVLAKSVEKRQIFAKISNDAKHILEKISDDSEDII